MKNALLCLLLGITAYAPAQTFEQWGDLDAGPFNVGYRSMLVYDYSRNYIDGRKPMQLYIWYPGVDATGTMMTFGNYIEDACGDFAPGDEWFDVISREVEAGFRSGALNPSFNRALSEKELQRIYDTGIPSRRNAKPAAGKFPLIIHSHVNGVLNQSILLEYLASHGFVVVSFSMYNTAPAHYARGEEGSIALLSYAEDVAFVLNQARSFDFIDHEKVAMIGMVAQVGLAFQSKEMLLDAIACHDCAINDGWLKELPFYDVSKITVPILELKNSEFGDQKLTYLDSLPFSERFVVRFRNFPHRDFYPFAKIAKPDRSTDNSNYEFVAKCTRRFLEATLKGDTIKKEELINSEKIHPQKVSMMRVIPARPRPPGRNEFLTWLRFGDMDRVRLAWLGEDLRSRVSQADLFGVILFLCRDDAAHAWEALQLYTQAFPADSRNRMLYNFLGDAVIERDPQMAIWVFDRYRTQFPQDLHALDKLSNAYAAAGDEASAKQTAGLLLTLLPESDLPSEEKQLLKVSAKKRIKGK